TPTVLAQCRGRFYAHDRRHVHARVSKPRADQSADRAGANDADPHRLILRTLVDDALRFAERTFDSTLLHDLHNGGNADEILDSICERRACFVAVGMPDTGRPLDFPRQLVERMRPRDLELL